MSSPSLFTINPKPFLGHLVGAPVAIRLKWHGMEYHGLLKSVDSYMNLQLAKTQEYIDGELKGQLGDILIRCNNVLYVREINNSTQPPGSSAQEGDNQEMQQQEEDQ